MKKISAMIALVIFAALITYLPNGVRRAYASLDIARIETEDAVFYADQSLNIARFTLPKSYYVKVVETGGEVTRVLYSGSEQAPACEGYVKTVSLSFATDPPDRMYPEKKITTVADEVMFSDPDLSRPRSVLSKGASAYYYGERNVSGEIYLYVYASGSVGYVKRSAFEDFSIPYHPVYAAEIAAANAASAKGSEDIRSNAAPSGAQERTEPAQVIVIAVLIVGVLCVVFLVFKREDKKAGANAFFRDDD